MGLNFLDHIAGLPAQSYSLGGLLGVRGSNSDVCINHVWSQQATNGIQKYTTLCTRITALLYADLFMAPTSGDWKRKSTLGKNSNVNDRPTHQLTSTEYTIQMRVRLIVHSYQYFCDSANCKVHGSSRDRI